MTTSTMSPAVARVDALQHEVASAEERARELERDQAEHARYLGQVRMQYRHTISEAKRLYPLFVHGLQASRLSVYRGNEQVQTDYQRLRGQLAALIGEADVARLETDAAYKPWWLTAER